MFKILTIFIISLLFIGCGPEKIPTVKSSMFQSVNKESAVLVQDGSEKISCSRCGMNLVKFYKTNHSAYIENKVYQYCSFHCLVDHLAEGRSLEDPKVVDASSLELIDIRAAYYVVGSKIKGTMTQVSKYAFSKEEDAKKFQADNGGEIMNFYKAMEIVKKDFKQ
ncbi:MAG: nitrous oxide reductase accessory protein NosL [Sulfurimonas sp.]|nr:nitrous oxide reductase accessory protein NosL [Sulfurimonas sp.]